MNKRSPSQKETLEKEPNYYQILGVTQDAPAEEIKKRYKALVLKFHPDKEKSYLAGEAMVSINNAYEVLSDPQRRLAYDVTLQENPKDIPVNENSTTKWKGQDFTKLLKKTRVVSLIVFVVVFSVAYETGSQTELSDENARTISDQFMKNTGTYYDIISHDAVLALPLFIPVFGIVWGVLAGISAGTIDKAITMVSPGLPVSGLVLLYTSSFGMIKLLAYCIGMFRSLTLADSIRKKRCGKDLVPTIRDAIIVVSLLSLAGLVEHAMISTA